MKSLWNGLKYIKYAFYMFLAGNALYLANIYYHSYWKLNLSYAGPMYYYWSVKYMDKNLARTTYSKIKKNEHKVSDMLDTYLDEVQNKVINNRYPLYAHGLPDSFVLGARRSWTLFDTPKKMDLELEFLQMRRDFIEKMHKVSPIAGSDSQAKPQMKSSHFIRMPRQDIEAFFINSGSSNVFVKQYANFQKIIGKLIAKTPQYGLVIKGKDALEMTPAFQEDVMKIVSSVFSNFNFTPADMNGFFTRLASLKATPMDAHIRNRINYYFLYTQSHINMDRLDVKEYNTLKNLLQEQPSENLTEMQKKKRKNILKRMGIMRTEILLNGASVLLADVMGEKGAMLEKNKDQRGILEALGLPAMASYKPKSLPRSHDPRHLNSYIVAPVS